MNNVLEILGRVLARLVLFYFLFFSADYLLDLPALPLRAVPADHRPEWVKTALEAHGKGLQWVYKVKAEATQWVGSQFLGVTVVIQMTGSGDTLRAYVGCLCAAALAATATLLWYAVVLMLKWPAARADAWLHGLVRVVVRFFLVVMLFGYGFAKVFPLQFPEPTYRLPLTFGDFSPMGLLWAFMGFSTAYQIFTGSVEVLAGLLLTTRRTTFLGAMLTVVAMTQIFALNMCFDVPVKLYSFHYLVMGWFLLAADMVRFLRAMVLYQGVEDRPPQPVCGGGSLNCLILVIRTVIVLTLLGTNIHQGYERWQETHGGPPAPASGRWEAELVQVDGKTLLKEDPRRWQTLDLSLRGIARLSLAAPPPQALRIQWNAEEKKVTLSKFRDPSWTAELQYVKPQPEVLELTGTVEGKPFLARLKQLPDKNYELTNRGFHWVQEFPYNR